MPCQMASITRRKNGKRRPWQEWAAWLLCSCFANLLSKVCPPKKNQRTMLPTLFRFGASQIECFQVPSWSFSNLLSFLATLSSLLVIFTSRQCIQRLEVGGVGTVGDISCFFFFFYVSQVSSYDKSTTKVILGVAD